MHLQTQNFSNKYIHTIITNSNHIIYTYIINDHNFTTVLMSNRDYNKLGAMYVC